jgi:hypothetical protein
MIFIIWIAFRVAHNGYGLGDVAVFENRQPITAAQ